MNLFDLKGRYFLVTGASGFLGREHCEAILMHNGIPVALDINNESLEILSRDLNNKYGVKVPIINASVNNIESLKSAKEGLHQKEIFISGIINNAAINPEVSKKGLSSSNLMENYDLDLWDLELNVGLKGSYLVVRTFSEDLLKNEYKSVIINISSDLGLIAPDQRIYNKQENLDFKDRQVKPITYSVIKAGLIGMTRYFATYFDGKIRSNAICPGGVLNNQNADFLSKVNKLIPLGRLANKEEYRGAIVFLLSDASSYMNGSIISIDGGRTTW